MSKYPDFEGGWGRGSSVGRWDPTKPAGKGQEAPLTPEYQKVFEANQAKQKAGIWFDPKATCGPPGMPRLMAMYEPMELIIKPKAVYMLFEAVNAIRRVWTDGRDWPKEPSPSWAGYSIGRWVDSKGAGRFDALEIETRHIEKGPRTYDGNGIPLAFTNDTVIKEKLYLDPNDPNIMRNEITTIDGALTRPWTVNRFYKRDKSPPEEFICTENDRWVVVGGRTYLTDAEGYFMPSVKDQPPPERKYFEKHFPRN
jgi:hypothetical protein